MADQTLFSEHMNSIGFQEKFKKHWRSQRDFKLTNLEIISKPFKVCRISNFLRDEGIIENLKSELEHHNHVRKVCDLYQFEKSQDLSCATDKCIQRLNSAFRTDLVAWMKRNTNIKLNRKVSMSSARYYDTDHLLCHDDNMSDRRIAYIFYLTNDWSEEDGGALDLFDTDEEGSPRKVVRSLIPEYNSLVFFEVTDNSYHQVAEILTGGKCRWSINGWFHGPLRKDFCKSPRLPCEPETIFVQPSFTEVDLHSWISDFYLAPGITEQIQNEVERTSSTYLKDFLKESVYQQIANDLTSRDISWRVIGPPDIRHYEIADEHTLPELLKDFCNLFKSISFSQLLMKYTELDLLPKEPEKLKITLELQRWSSGCYTLLYDKSEDTSESIKIERFDDKVNVDDAAASTSTSGFSSSETNPDASETRRELKRERIDDSRIPANSPDKKKVARYLDNQSDVSTQLSSKHEHGMMGEISSLPDETLSRSGTPTSDSEDDSAMECEFLLDVIIQFHATDAKGIPKTEDTIDFVDPREQQGTLIQVPARDNHLCLAYRSIKISRLQKYLNHCYDGYTYTFILTYYDDFNNSLQ